MCAVGVCRKKAKKKPLLMKKMKEARLQWAKDNLIWGIEEWKYVLWSDELKFNLFSSDSSCLLRRQSHEEFYPDCIQRTVKFPASVMLWGCFSWFGIGRLHICENRVDQKTVFEYPRKQTITDDSRYD